MKFNKSARIEHSPFKERENAEGLEEANHRRDEEKNKHRDEEETARQIFGEEMKVKRNVMERSKEEREIGKRNIEEQLSTESKGTGTRRTAALVWKKT